MRVLIRAFLVAALMVAATGSAQAQLPSPEALPPDPTPDPTAPNLFYGATLPASANGPILVFVHGLSGTAMDWWVNNNMYQLAYLARYRTAFISLNADNSPNDKGLDDNAAMLRALLPKVAAHFNGEQFYVIGHSKGGLDVQAALLYPSIRPLVKGVFTISTPNQGTELADWAFGPGLPIAGKYNLLTAGVFALQTDRVASFRALADPVLKASGIPFYTMTGDSFLGHPITDITGLILKQLAPGLNDGLVTVGRSKLPGDYAADLGTFHQNHFFTDNGTVSFSRIQSVIGGLENTLAEFKRVATNGLGDPHNTWIWSMKWFKGALYVGTGREDHCLSLATSQALGGPKVYSIGVLAGDCPADLNEFTQSLAAEIWRYEPAIGRWTRVYKSPSVIPMGQDANGNPVMLGRDVGFRGMEIYKEADGTEALYVGGVSAGSAFSVVPPYSTMGFPPPRILRTTDGANWQALPQAPGTFLGDIAKPRTGSSRYQWSFRGLTSYHGKLFATATDFRGVGMIIASDNPLAGNNAWYQVTGIPEQFPVWNITVFNDYLYATTGDQALDNNPGTGLYKTNAAGSPPYTWTPIFTNAGYQPDPRLQSSDGLSFMEFKGQLYLGTNRPTELYRINTDDTWDLIVGEPRVTPQGVKAPLSGLGIGFGSWFIGHFWRMGTINDQLFLSTWDWSVQLRGLADFDHVFDDQYGFDLMRTTDGIHWTAVSRNGLGDPDNYGGRSFETTPYGLFLGTARMTGGGQVFQCRTPTCEPVASAIAPPTMVQAESEFVSGRTAVISWQPVDGALKYRVYRATVQPIGYFLGQGANVSLQIPGTDQVITLDAINAGQYDSLCQGSASSTLCEAVNVVRDAATADGVASFPLPWEEIAVTTDTMYTEPAPTSKQSLYFVAAEDAQGNVSTPSNFVGAPSKALPSAPPTITAQISPQPNGAGWNNTPVTVTWTIDPSGTDTLLSEPCPPVTISADTPGTTLSCAAVSGSGARASKAVRVKIDSVPPTITGTRSPQANALGWNNTDVTVSFTCEDDNAGIFACSPAEQVVSADGANQYRSAVAVDLAGNKTTATVSGINVDKTPPTITGARAPLANAAGWNNTDVTVSFTCADSVSGVGTCGPAAQIVSTEGVNQSRTATVVDRAGNTASAVVDGINIDKTAPTIAGSRAPLANTAGWNNTDVTVSFTCADALSGVSACTEAQLIGTEGANQARTGTVTDLAGNSATAAVGGISIDKTAPVIVASRAPEANPFGWNNTDVAVSYACSDALSGVATCSATDIVSAEGADQSRTGNVTDLAGNSAAASLGGISIDKTAPVILATPSPVANAAGWNNTSVTISFSATDALSGIASLSSPVTIASEGAGQVVTGVAVDKAGNAMSVSATLNIDLTPPEALVRFEPITRRTVVLGTDGLAGVTTANAITPTLLDSEGLLRSYLITDAAGNTLQTVLSFDGPETGAQSHARMQSVQYNGGDVRSVVPNQLQFEASLLKGGGVNQLAQNLQIEWPNADEQEVSGKFSSQKNLTVIKAHAGESIESLTAVPGLALVHLVTSDGQIAIKY